MKNKKRISLSIPQEFYDILKKISDDNFDTITWTIIKSVLYTQQHINQPLLPTPPTSPISPTNPKEQLQEELLTQTHEEYMKWVIKSQYTQPEENTEQPETDLKEDEDEDTEPQDEEPKPLYTKTQSDINYEDELVEKFLKKYFSMFSKTLSTRETLIEELKNTPYDISFIEDCVKQFMKEYPMKIIDNIKYILDLYN